MGKEISKVDDNYTPLNSGDGGKSYWKKWYTALIAFLLLQVILYYFITEHFK